MTWNEKSCKNCFCYDKKGSPLFLIQCDGFYIKASSLSWRTGCSKKDAGRHPPTWGVWLKVEKPTKSLIDNSSWDLDIEKQSKKIKVIVTSFRKRSLVVGVGRPSPSGCWLLERRRPSLSTASTWLNCPASLTAAPWGLTDWLTDLTSLGPEDGQSVTALRRDDSAIQDIANAFENLNVLSGAADPVVCENTTEIKTKINRTKYF